MDKMTHTKFNLNNFLMALSPALDKKIQLTKEHYSSKRIAFIALKIASFNDISAKTLSDMFSYIVLSKHKEAISHLSSIPFNDFSLLQSQTIQDIFKLALTVENNLKIENKFIINKQEIITSIEREEAIDEIIKENFFYLADNVSFWLDLMQEDRLGYHIFNMLDDFTIEYEYIELLKFTKIFYDMVYSYTNHSYNNSTISDKIALACQHYNFDNKDTARMILSGYLHNIGLLHIPHELFTKENNLSEVEYQIIQSAPYFTKYVLEQIFGFDDIAKFASATNESLDGSGYPYNLEGHELSLKHRIMNILYIYQALSEDRSYRKGLNKEDTFEVLESLAQKQKIDASVLKDIKSFI
jgi:HD-GYP domain-containing protein (c-di-GMP phosphodiesterase class II)